MMSGKSRSGRWTVSIAIGLVFARRRRFNTTTPSPEESWRAWATASDAAVPSKRRTRAPGRCPREAMSSEKPMSGRSCFLSGEDAT
jgi:hypothetical protein